MGSRTIDSGFFGVGLPHIGVEATIAMTNKLLMHFGCSTATGRFMQISYSLLLMELGLSFQPLQVEYDRYNHLVTHTWMKVLWEKVSMFGLMVTTPSASGGFPREGDEYIMQVILRAGYNSDEVCVCVSCPPVTCGSFLIMQYQSLDLSTDDAPSIP